MTKVIIVDDQQFLANSLKRVLSSRRGLEVVATAFDHLGAVSCAETCPHDVVLMDIMLGGGSGLDATREISRRVPTTKIIFMSAHVDPAYVAEALAQQAAGYWAFGMWTRRIG
jgi:DNA-binding NarL/FixJ family response regulator